MGFLPIHRREILSMKHAVLGVLLGAVSATAQTYTWSTFTGTNLWSDTAR
jgi:hypothetical protein